MRDEQIITSVEQLIDELGGLAPTSEALGAKEGTVTAWLYRGTLPANLYVAHTAILQKRGLKVSPTLWRQELPKTA